MYDLENLTVEEAILKYKKCNFQMPIINAEDTFELKLILTKFECTLTESAWMDASGSKWKNSRECNLEFCPMYQTWKLQEKIYQKLI